MAFQPVVDTVQIQLVGREDAQLTINDLYFFHANGAPSVGDQIALLDSVCGWYAGGVGSLASVAWNFVLGRSRLLTTQFGLVLTNASHATGGGVGGEASPNNVTFAISFRTAVGGRGGRGRNYVPGLAESAVLGNVLDPTFITNYINVYNALLPGGGVIDPPWAWVIVHRQAGGVLLPAGEVNSVEAVVATDNIVDSQRRRLPGRGR